MGVQPQACTTTNSDNYCRKLGIVAGELVWGRDISTKKAIRLAKELLAGVEQFSKSSKAKQWAKDSFSTMQDMLKTVMAFHVLAFTASWSASSGVECLFSFFKKFKAGELKRSMLCDAVVELLLMVERRLSADAQILLAHSWFIDERNAETSDDKAKAAHEKRLGTSRLFGKELMKLQIASNCSWSEAIKLENRCMWLLRERNGVESEVLHLVDLTGFLWSDSPDNIPPRCHTCPCHRNGRIPCVGILTVLQNLPPLVGTANLFEWGSGGLKKPEIFHGRWRVDKDPSRVLMKYCLAATRQASHPQHSTVSEPLLPASQVIPADVTKMHEDQMRRVSKLDPRAQTNVLKNMMKLLSQNASLLAKYELDSMIHKVSKGVSKWGQGQLSIIEMRRGNVRQPRKKPTTAKDKPDQDPAPAPTAPAAASAVVAQGDQGIRFLQKGSQMSSVARAKVVPKAQIPAGTSKRVPEDNKWHCQVCNRRVKNSAQCVNQHCEGSTHAENVTEWRRRGSKNWELFHCRHCNFTVDESDPERNASLIREHMVQHLEQTVGKKR